MTRTDCDMDKQKNVWHLLSLTFVFREVIRLDLNLVAYFAKLFNLMGNSKRPGICTTKNKIQFKHTLPSAFSYMMLFVVDLSVVV